MNPTEARQLIEMLETAFGDLSDERFDLYTRSILSQHAADVSTAVLKNVMKTWSRMPAIADLHAAVEAERRARLSQRPVLLPPVPPKRPEWVSRWQDARKNGDTRWFPEQVAGARSLGYDVPTEPFDDTGIWVQPKEYA